MHAVVRNHTLTNEPVGIATSRQTASGTTDVTLSEAGPDETFEESLTREIGRSEQLRLGIAASMFGISCVPWIVAWISNVRGFDDRVPDLSTLWPLIALGGLAVTRKGDSTSRRTVGRGHFVLVVASLSSSGSAVTGTRISSRVVAAPGPSVVAAPAPAATAAPDADRSRQWCS